MLKLIVISDSTGETCEQIVRAAFAQFDIEEREIERHSNVRNIEVLNKIIDKIDNFEKTIVFYSLVDEHLIEHMTKIC